jgi:arylsulfatase A-like enzyme
MSFTDAHSGSSVCTPSRYGILTGRYAWRTTLKRGVLDGESPPLIAPNRLTVAKLLKENGYHTACIGKWHLGWIWARKEDGSLDYSKPVQNGPAANGFDYYYCLSGSLDMPPYVYVENDRVTAAPNRITSNSGEMTIWRKGDTGADFVHRDVLSKFTDRAIEYLRNRGKQRNPFFLYLALPSPHTPILPTDRFRGKSGTNAYGDFVLQVDDSIGQVMQAVDEAGISQNTIFIVTSDNGCSPRARFHELATFGHNPSYHFRGYKADIFEGGHRIPFLVRWPGRVAAGSDCGATICLTDFMRTCADLVGVPLPDDAGEDSVSFLPALLDERSSKPLRADVVHHSFNGSFAIRKGRWKLALCPGSGGWSNPTNAAREEKLPLVQLYDLTHDIGETTNMANEHPEVVKSLTATLRRQVVAGRSTPGKRQDNEGKTPILPPDYEKERGDEKDDSEAGADEDTNQQFSATPQLCRYPETTESATAESKLESSSSLLADDNQTDTELQNRPERLEWLRDAGFGLFVHWSVDSQLGSVISHNLVGASDDYTKWYFNELLKTFSPRHWNPEELAELAKICGAKHVVFTAKHHNGFCMWDTKTTPLHIMNTPYGQGIVRSYVDAIRRQGLAVGLYYSPEDFLWMHENEYEVTRDRLPFDPITHPPIVMLVEAQTRELFTNYGKIDVLFIDGEGAAPVKQVAWSLQPDCSITRGAIETPEQYIPDKPPDGPWESCFTIGPQWQYKPTNEQYKSGTKIIEMLIETRAKGGALLLNVGPMPDGRVPIEQESRLREVALWIAVSNKASYNSRPWTVTNEGNIWFTKSKDADTVYAFLTGIPDWERGTRHEFLLQSVAATDTTTINVLGQSGRVLEYIPDADATSRLTQTTDGLSISVVRAQRLYNDHKWPNPVVVEITHAKRATTKSKK